MSATLFVGPGETARLLALCPHPAEAVCAREIEALPGVSEVSQRHGAVTFRGTRAALYLANLALRTPSRILCPLSDWPCRGERDLYDQARELPWEAFLSPRGTLAVSANGQLPGLENGMFTAQRVKDAICDRFRDLRGVRPDVDPEDPDLLVNVQLYEEDGRGRCAIALDSSGAPLHRRGYRGAGGRAPLKETLGATILLLAGYDGRTLVDPCCGSGTLLIEGGLLALDRAPGLGRGFGFQRWRGFDEALFRRLRDELSARARPAAAEAARRGGPFLHGGDLDEGALQAARSGAQAAGLLPATLLTRQDLRTANPPPALHGPAGLVVCNPPYGERLGEEAELQPLYRALGDTLKRRFHGWDACVFTANLRLAREIGLKPKRRDILWNGPLEGRLLHFSLY